MFKRLQSEFKNRRRIVWLTALVGVGMLVGGLLFHERDEDDRQDPTVASAANQLGEPDETGFMTRDADDSPLSLSDTEMIIPANVEAEGGRSGKVVHADEEADDLDLALEESGEAKAVKRSVKSPVAAVASEDLGLKVPEGFTITRYADDSLAHDIFSMTIDSLGRVVVSGPGYVRILVDSDGDGKADRAIDYADGPKSGAQGMCFFARDLLCTGDAGLIHYKDEDGDDRADGAPEVLMKIKTGSEHDAHAIRRGPDGWWYVIAGNMAEVTKGHATEKTSPIKTPHGGVILRMKPDSSGAEIIADCFRNAYDFDFDAQGELLTYDSDDNPDYSLPWYMPTRVFHVLQGGEHGWISESSQHPDYLIDSAPVVAATGRASPAGVVCYRHTQFPEQYRGGLFLLDWAFGRVMHVPLKKNGATYATQTAADFITASGQMGFAPTDVEIGLDGSMYICVGGRGTHGTVYRVQYTGAASEMTASSLLTVTENDTSEQKLAACLNAPQPSSSWSRARWVPLATKLGAQAFLSVALDETQTVPERIRAIEILTDLFTGLPGTAAEILAMVKTPELRARAVWSLGARPPEGLSPAVLVQYLHDADPLVRRHALEAASRFPGDATVLLPAIARCSNDDDRVVRLAAARLLTVLKPAEFKEVADAARKLSWRAALTTTLGYVWRTQESNQGYNAYGIDICRRILEGKHSNELKLEAARLVQIALGDVAQSGNTAAVFSNYTTDEDLTAHERDLDPLRTALAKVFPTGQRHLDLELSRVAAMITPANDDLFGKVLAQINPDSSPSDDLHYLIVAARLPVNPGQAQRELIARSLLNIEQKLADRKLYKDSNWNSRIGELYAALVSRDPELASRIVADPAFGRPGHVLFMANQKEQQTAQGVAAFMRAVQANPDYAWNNDVVFVIGYGKTAAHRDLVRKQYEKFELRMACLMVLAEPPEEQDREKFAAGLDSPPIEIVTICVGALEKLPATRNAVELVALVKALRRLGTEKNELAARERIIKLLERNTGERYASIFGTAGYKSQPEIVEKWTDWVTQNYPDEVARQLGGSSADLTKLKERLVAVEWNQADIERGRKLYTARGCAQCHSAGSGLGPDLAGAAGRFSRDDLFIAIAVPNRDVSPRYQTTFIETKSGKVYTGMIVYEEADGLLLRNGVNQTFRIETSDIESRRTLPTSLMPEQLLKDLSDSDLADLYGYLTSLAARTAKRDKAEDGQVDTE